MSMLRVGYIKAHYPEKRNIIHKVSNVNYILLKDFYSVLQHVRGSSKFFPTRLRDAEFKFSDFGLNKVNLIHFFNTVSFGQTPWVSTFETIIPRYRLALACRESNPIKLRSDSEVLRALDALSSGSCKKIIAISEGTAKMQNEFLKLFPDHGEEILSKQVILHPPQEIMRRSFRTEHRTHDEKTPIKFIIVGHQFFSKGGREVLSTFSDFRKKIFRSLQLVIVSKIMPDDYCTCTGEDDVKITKQFIEHNKDWITYYPLLPRNEVLSLVVKCDVGLLPSYAETYGYSVLEYQSLGLPVVTTNIRSFPEINNDNIGWVIPIPKRYDGEARYKEPGGKENISRSIKKGLENILQELVNNPDLIADKGRKALERIKHEHNPYKYANKLRKIYEDALNF